MGSYGSYGKQPAPAKIVEEHMGNMDNVQMFRKVGKQLWVVSRFSKDGVEFNYATLLLVSQYKDEYIIKPMDEFCGPNYYSIPKNMLKLLTPLAEIKRRIGDKDILSDSCLEWAENWRNKVVGKATEKKIDIVNGLLFKFNQQLYKVSNPVYNKSSFLAADIYGKNWKFSKRMFYNSCTVENPMQEVQGNLF